MRAGLFVAGLCATFSVVSSARSDIPPGPPPISGRASAEAPAESVALLARHGCTGCHSVDGREGVGPSFAGTIERHGVSPEELRSFLVIAIREPSLEVTAGYADVMPAFMRLSDAEVDALVDAVVSIPPAPTPEPTLAGVALLGGMLAFVLLHFLLSGPARAPLVAKLGENAFMGVYSLLVGAPFVVALIVWSDVPYVPLWTPPKWAPHLVITLMFPALFFIVAGYTTKSPTTAGMANATNDPPRGVITITRHPALVGFTIWGLAHLVANGTLRDLAFFGGMVVLSVGGMLHIDARRRRALPDAWPTFASRTSVIPFAAILSRRTKLDGSGLLLRLVITAVLYAALVLALHRWAFGVPAFPPEWGLGW